MGTMLTGVAEGTVTLVLIVAFAGHVLRPGALIGALRAHRTLPRSMAAPVAVLAIALEGVLGAAGAYAVITRSAHLVFAGSAVLLGGYAVYAFGVHRARPAVPCGCDAAGTPMNGWVAGRAAALTVLSIGAAAGADAPWGANLAITMLAAMAFATLLWILPAAMIDPDGPDGRAAV
jgi:hypothetical protein